MTIWIRLAFLALSILIFVSGGNCAPSNIRRMVREPSSQATAKGNLCSMMGSVTTQAAAIIFLVDMSYSNISTTGFDPPGTDNPLVRLNKIRAFLSSSCATASANNKFAVLGFSTTKVPSSYACSRTSLVSATDVNNQISQLESIQTSAQAAKSNAIMDKTYYAEGFNCVGNLIEDDINNPASGENLKDRTYIVYFLTDGLPNASGRSFRFPSTFLAETPQAYGDFYFNTYLKATIDKMKDRAGQDAGGLMIQPIAYGFDKITSKAEATAEEQRQAGRQVLNRIAQAGDSFFDEVNNPINFDFCKYLKEGRRTKMVVQDFWVSNLTSTWIQRSGQSVLVPDSDMDGIADELEDASLGFNPAAMRSGTASRTLIDGLCPAGRNISECTTLGVSDCGKPNGLGLTKCDLNGINADGIDSDRDGMIDLLEMLKGTSWNVAGGTVTDESVDLDGDQVSNYLELKYGRNPRIWDNEVADSPLTMKYKYQLSPSPVAGCPANQDSYTFELENIPLVLTRDVPQPTDSIGSKISFASHGAKENIILISYIVKKQNESAQGNEPRYLYGQFIKVNFDNKNVGIGPFQLLGTIDGAFREVP